MRVKVLAEWDKALWKLTVDLAVFFAFPYATACHSQQACVISGWLGCMVWTLDY